MLREPLSAARKRLPSSPPRSVYAAPRPRHRLMRHSYAFRSCGPFVPARISLRAFLGKSQATGLLASLFPEMNKAIGVWKKAFCGAFEERQSDAACRWTNLLGLATARPLR